jgi:hypothetical protein
VSSAAPWARPVRVVAARSRRKGGYTRRLRLNLKATPKLAREWRELNRVGALE